MTYDLPRACFPFTFNRKYFVTPLPGAGTSAHVAAASTDLSLPEGTMSRLLSDVRKCVISPAQEPGSQLKIESPARPPHREQHAPARTCSRWLHPR